MFVGPMRADTDKELGTLDIRRSLRQCPMFIRRQNTSRSVPQAGDVSTTIPTKLPTLLQWRHRKSL